MLRCRYASSLLRTILGHQPLHLKLLPLRPSPEQQRIAMSLQGRCLLLGTSSLASEYGTWRKSKRIRTIEQVHIGSTHIQNVFFFTFKNTDQNLSFYLLNLLIELFNRARFLLSSICNQFSEAEMVLVLVDLVFASKVPPDGVLTRFACGDCSRLDAASDRVLVTLLHADAGLLGNAL